MFFSAIILPNFFIHWDYRGHLLQAGPSSGSHSVPYLPLTQPYHLELPKMCLLQAHGKDSGYSARGPQQWGSLYPCYTDLEELSPSTVSSSQLIPVCLVHLSPSIITIQSLLSPCCGHTVVEPKQGGPCSQFDQTLTF